MLVKCGSNNVTISNGLTGPTGYSCLYGSDYESISASVNDIINTGNYVIKDDSGATLKVTLSTGRWLVKSIVTIKNTDPGGGHPDAIYLLMNGGPINGYGASVMSGYSWTAVDGDTYTVYHIFGITDEILSGTKDITLKVSAGVVAGTLIATGRSIVANKITNFTLV